jgi:hypothetical protein
LVSYIKGRSQTEEFEDRVLKKIFGPKREDVTGENYIMRRFITSHH